MKGKIVQKIISGGLLVSLLFTNITNVLAATIVRPSNFMENKLSLHDFSIITGATNYDKGYAGIKAQVSNDKKTINVTLTVSTKGVEPTAITNVQTKVDLGEDITNNFDVNVPSQDGVMYTTGTQTINWLPGDIAADVEKTMTYTLTLKDSYNFDEFSNSAFSADRFYVLSLFHVWHSLEGNNQPAESGTQFSLEKENCVPFVIIDSDETSSNVPTGLFTDIVILSSIIVGAVGILVVTLKSNRFSNI